MEKFNNEGSYNVSNVIVVKFYEGSQNSLLGRSILLGRFLPNPPSCNSV